MKGIDILRFLRKPLIEGRIFEGKMPPEYNLHGEEQISTQLVERERNYTPQPGLRQMRISPEKVLEELGSPGLGEINLKQ